MSTNERKGGPSRRRRGFLRMTGAAGLAASLGVIGSRAAGKDAPPKKLISGDQGPGHGYFFAGA